MLKGKLLTVMFSSGSSIEWCSFRVLRCCDKGLTSNPICDPCKVDDNGNNNHNLVTCTYFCNGVGRTGNDSCSII
ncbi:unnamed protein product [Rotaria sp. Silwood2]|nr:unnamed protein product [Rotaria sp. Silwood2]